MDKSRNTEALGPRLRGDDKEAAGTMAPMNEERAEALRGLLRTQDIGALGTLHQGEPFVSMVPYALLADGALVVHVSQLATHTRDMELHPGVSLMVLGARTPDLPAQAVPRATLQCDARVCPSGGAAHAQARDAYLARFPQAEDLFAFADFSLFRLVPRSVRFVGGFAQAWSATGADYAAAMAA